VKIQRKLLIGLATIVMFSGTTLTTISETSTVQAASPYTSLQNSINNVMTDSRMTSASTSVTIRKASTGEIIYQKNGDKGITPASSLKILTASAALETLGENHRFSTDLLTNGTVAKGTLYGNLYLRGQGDPTLMKKDFDHFASMLANRGVKRLSGHIIGDDTWFDADRLSPGIAKEDESYYYAARISALSLSPNTDYDAGSVIVDAKPSVNGRVANITLTPATGVVRIVNQSRTVPKGYSNTLKIKREYGTNKVIISGNVPLGSAGKKEWITVSNPTAYALDVFKKSLASKGITFVSTSKVVSGTTPKNARVLLSKKSMPLKDLMIPFLKLSNNTHAEVLAKEMGKVKYGVGSWDAGLRVMREYADSVGLDVNQWVFEDASGMSHANKIPSSQLTQLLHHVRSEPWYGTFLKGLPIAGGYERFVGGTLRLRMKTAPAKGNVMAKTGSLDNVSALAGYAKTRDGELLIFTVQTQNTKSSTVPVIDRLATSIANSKKTP
jgi:D-alanyl-D-alanine carboxypeptidase/D-alanyl-D-alanine-endopeptidase (penicillin-binding protein 4)